MLFVPKGFALGFQTLEDETEIFYQMTQKYMPKYTGGIRWDDPKLDIKWPLKPTVISQKDKSWELL
jgi:dTDP-4-dehydrorhamnose 3,5-epimerase